MIFCTTETQWSISDGHNSVVTGLICIILSPIFTSLIVVSNSVFRLAVASRIREKNAFEQKEDFSVAFRKINHEF